jgi:hypothetical protein
MDPKGIECYVLATSMHLQFPFSRFLLAKLDSLKPLFIEDTVRMEDLEENMDEAGNLTAEALQEQVERFRSLANYTLGNDYVLEAMKRYLMLFGLVLV